MSDVTASLDRSPHEAGTLALSTLAYRLARTLDESQLHAVEPLLRPETAAALRALYERSKH